MKPPNAVYKVIPNPDKGNPWLAVDDDGLIQWSSSDEQFIRRFARDIGFRHWVLEQCIKGEQLTMKLRGQQT